jgi:hypothetical protein
MAGEHDRMAYVAKDRPHIAEQSVHRETGDDQNQSISTHGIIVCSDVVGRPEGTNNDRDGGADLWARQPGSGSDLRV